METDTETAKFDLTCVVRDRAETLEVCLEYATAAFDDVTIGRLLAHWQILLAGIIADPNRPVSQLPLLRPEEERRAISDWNNTGRPYPDQTNVAALFEEVVEQQPEALALRYGVVELTYGQLNHRANQVAHGLKARAWNPAPSLPSAWEGSIELIVGMLGCQAGGAYVPLDLSHPPERLAHILKDTHALLALVQDGWRGSLPATQAKVVHLNSLTSRHRE